jgi:carbon storage regulator CsrA
MLLLKRNPGEGITLALEDGREIRIAVADVLARQVHLAIEAPRSIQISRDELVPNQPRLVHSPRRKGGRP